MLVLFVGLMAVLMVAILSRDHDITASQETIVTAELHLADTALASFPDRVHLTAFPAGEFTYHDRVRAAREGLASEGFADAGSYALDGLPGVRVLLMTHARDRMSATVYEHERAGVWAEVVSRYEDGRRWTHTTLAGDGLETRAGNTLITVPGVPLAELLARARADRPDGRRERVDRNAVAEWFTRDYAAWIAERKGRVVRGDFAPGHADDDRQLPLAA